MPNRPADPNPADAHDPAWAQHVAEILSSSLDDEALAEIAQLPPGSSVVAAVTSRLATGGSGELGA